MLTDNSAVAGGRAYGGTLHNCTLMGNSAENWGGGAVGGTLYNCTVTHNSSRWGGGVCREGKAACTLCNCIVYFNQALYHANHEGATFEYSCTTPLPIGPGNIDANPGLLTATHLSPTSPCVGAGNPTYASGVDIDGDPWATPPAIGADQPVPGSATGPLELWIDAGFTNFATGYPVSFAALNTGPILKTVWDFGDGALLTNQGFASHAWSAPGVYMVRLTGYNDSHPDGVTASVAVTVSDAVYYVSQASVNPVFPFASWDTAATTIQDAIRAGSLAGRLVLVTNGVYRTGTVETNGLNRVALINATVVRSVNGPEVTTIEGETNGVRCAYVGTDSVLSGFTLTKGTAAGVGDWPSWDGGGVLCELGLVTNCVLSKNWAIGAGGGAHGGTLRNCTLTDNTSGGSNSAGYGGGAFESTLYDCTLAGNSTRGKGGGAYGGSLHRCTLNGNSADESGGGASGATLYSCALIRNSANQGGGAHGGSL
jgi:PKD repeat protein